MIETLRNGFLLTGKAFEYLSREVRGMHAAAYVLALSALLSSLLALFRDRLLAHTFGAGMELDIYYAAFRIPDLLFVCFGALASAYVLIPVLASRDEVGQRRYIDAVLISFAVVSVGASAIIALFAPQILERLFPVLTAGGSSATLILLTRILLVQPILLGLSNIIGAVTQSRHRYVLYAAAPIFYNFGIIVGIVALYPVFGLAGLAWGVCLGAFLHLGIQIPSALNDGLVRTAALRTEFRAICETVRISIPRALALAAGQLSFLGLLAIAGGLASGSISVFMFAFNLQAVPLAVIGASYSVAAFPTLALLSQNGSRDFVRYVATATRHILFWSLPALCLVIVLRAHVVRVVLGSGEFDWTDTRLTAAALALFAVSLAAQSLTLLLVRAYYAAGKTLVPLVVSVSSAALSVIFGYVFLRALEDVRILSFFEALFRVEYVPGAEILALPFAYSLAALLGVLVLACLFNKDQEGYLADIRRTLGQSLVAGLAAVFAAYGTLTLVGVVTFFSTLGSVLVRGGFAGVAGLFAATLVYHLLGSREYGETLQALKRRIWRDAEPISSAETASTPR